MGGVGQLACQGILVREACVTLGSLYVDVQGYVPVLLENLRGMSCSKIYWLLGGG